MRKTFIDLFQEGNDPKLPILGSRRPDGSTASEDLMGFPKGLGKKKLMLMKRLIEMLLRENCSNVFQTYADAEFMLAASNVRGGLRVTLKPIIITELPRGYEAIIVSGRDRSYLRRRY